jgi:bla regulator protein blaR1
MLIPASSRLRKTILFASCFFASIILALVTCAGLDTVHAAQTSPAAAQAAPASPHDIADTFQGTLHTGRDLRLVVKITKDDKGAYKGVFYSIDQGGQPLTLDSVTLNGSDVKMELKLIGGTFTGKLSSDGKTIDGNWSQGPTPLPLVLTRATPETEWAIPTPPPPVPPMAADANPSFEVATIKPSVPNRPGKGFGFRADRFRTVNTNLNDLIAFAYGLHAKQIVGAPDWFGTDLFDIEAKPDTEGRPSQKQMADMVQKLLADRFKLTFHKDKKELAVYVVSVAGGEPKMRKSAAAPTDPPAFFFRQLGDLVVRNQTMGDFATWMQSGVMDRPVVDQTGLTGKYDFELKWTPDESQFGQFRGTGVTIPPPTDEANAPPGLYTAIQEQLGLKMGPAKIPDDVIVIDHAEKPTPN